MFQDERSLDVTRAGPAETKVVQRRRNRLSLSGSFTVSPPQCGREHFHHGGGMKATPELISESSSQRLGSPTLTFPLLQGHQLQSSSSAVYGRSDEGEFHLRRFCSLLIPTNFCWNVLLLRSREAARSEAAAGIVKRAWRGGFRISARVRA